MRAGNPVSRDVVSVPLTLTLSPKGERGPEICWLGVAVSALLLTLLLSSIATADPVDLGRPVSAVELRLDAPIGRRIDLEPLIAIRVGALLTEQKVRRTLSNLQATGLFSEIEIRSRRDPPGPDGAPRPTVTAVVVLRDRPWVSSVELRGERRLSDPMLLKAVTQKPGGPLVEDRVLESVYALKDLYHEYGYREADVRLEIEPAEAAAPANRRVVVGLRIASGPRAEIVAIDFEGDLGLYQPIELRSAMRATAGSRYQRERVEADADRLERWLRRRGHLQARVDAARETYDRDSDGMRLVYPLSVGPRVELELDGISRKRLKRQGFLSFLEDEGLDPLSLDQQCQKLENRFQRKGRYQAEVTCALEPPDPGGEAASLTLRVDVEPGAVHELAEVTFTGNIEVAADQLRSLMVTGPRKRFQPGSGRLVREQLEEDLDNIRSYYLLQGFGEAEVGTWTIFENDTRLELEIEIHEGRRQRVVDFTFSGLEILDLDQVRASLPLAPGGPYHPALLDDSLNIVRALYEDRGFTSTNVAPRFDWNDEQTLVDVHFEVDEGPQAVVDRLILRGQRRTQTDALRRLIRLDKGEPASRRRLLEVERDLYRLGVFSNVDVSLRPVAESSEQRDVVVRLEEGTRYRLAYGFSYHSGDGLGGLFSVTRANVSGRGDRLQLDLRGNEVDSRFRLLYDQPLLGRFNLPVTYSLFRETQDRDSFSVNSLGAQVAVTQDLPSIRLRGVLEYRSVDIRQKTPAFDDLDPNDVEREDREVEIFSLIPIFYLDRRDDPLDPERGWSSAVQLEHALPFAGAETHFLKLFWQHTHYFPLGRAGSLATSFRLGAIEPLDSQAERDPLVPTATTNALVPISERFFAGGRTSHRAYDRDRLGIFGQTLFPSGADFDDAASVGGNGLFVLNLDYRFPIADPVGGVVFFDLGNVWADWRDLHTRDLKPGAGLGLRYVSPIGPVRLEIGWKLDPVPGEDKSPVFFLSFGNPF